MPSTLQKQLPPPKRFNEDDKCIPQGKCPDGYGWLDNDETGRCYSERDRRFLQARSRMHQPPEETAGQFRILTFSAKYSNYKLIEPNDKDSRIIL